MKRKFVMVILCIVFILELFYLQVSRNPTVSNVVTCNDCEGYNANLTVTANKIVIFDQDKLQQDLIDRLLNNNFQNMLFSYDIMGYPEDYTVTVYTNDWTKKLGIPAFTFRYAPNI